MVIMISDIENEAKQKYLRENILDNGYSTENFINHLLTLKGQLAYDCSERRQSGFVEHGRTQRSRQ